MPGYLIGAPVIAMAWVPVSVTVALALAGAEDNQAETAAVPWPLRLAWAVVSFPMRYLGQWDRSLTPLGVSENGFMFVVYFGMFVNGLLWGALLIFLYRLAACLLPGKNGKKLG
jgi:hypothetical protein